MQLFRTTQDLFQLSLKIKALRVGGKWNKFKWSKRCLGWFSEFCKCALTLAQWRKHIDLPCFQDVGRWKLVAISSLIGVKTFHWYAFLARFTRTFKNSFVHIVGFLICKLCSKRWSALITLVWIRFHVKFPYFIYTLTE